MMESLSGLLTVTSSTSRSGGMLSSVAATEKAREQQLQEVVVSGEIILVTTHLSQSMVRTLA